MPSISRGLHRWLFRPGAVLEDFADRLNHFWTVGLLLVLACVISWKHNYGDPIKCWCPAVFVNQHCEYANSICWNSYTIEYPRDVKKALELLSPNDNDALFVSRIPIVSEYPPVRDSPLLKKASSTVTLYQWLPLILCFQALLFKLPNVIMYVFHEFTGISFDKIAGLTSGYNTLNLAERQALGRQVARYLYRWCTSMGSCLPCRRLTCVWLLVKTLFCINIITQTVILDGYLTTKDPPLDNSTSFWDAISGNLYENNATLWKTSPHFPKTIFCNYIIRQFTNIHRYTLQCQLPANLFNERVYMFLWLWFVFVSLVTCLSAQVYIILTLIHVPRKRYITKALEISDDVESCLQNDVNKFCDVIGEDGVMVLKLMGANSSELFVRDVVCSMWSLWKKRPDDSRTERAGIELA